MQTLADRWSQFWRKWAIHRLCPEIDQIADDILATSQAIIKASVATDEIVAGGDLAAYYREPGASILRAESRISSPIFAIQDLRDGTPHRSRGYNAPGKWGSVNRRRAGR